MTGILDATMPHESWTWVADHTIPSNTGAGRQVLDHLLEQLQRAEWNEHDRFGVHLAVEEALVNAIKHGNRNEPQKSVHVVCRLAPDRMVIEITDEGDGFDPDSVPDPTAEENLDVPSGRGLMLMRCFMSRVEFNNVGNQVVMEKVRSDQPAD